MTSTAAAVVALSLALIAHNRSEGTSRFTVHDDGRVDVEIRVTDADLDELCGLSLTWRDPARLADAKRRLQQCAQDEMPTWLRLRDDVHACELLPQQARDDGREVVFVGTALCPGDVRGHALTLDWGLFAGTGLDHVSTSTLVLPDGGERKTLLSKRHNKVIATIPAATSWARGAAVGAALLAGGTAIALLVRRWRSRRRHAVE